MTSVNGDSLHVAEAEAAAAGKESCLLSKPCHEHGVYYGNDNWDADCCICCDSPCGSVDVERMRRHRLWDLRNADRYLAYVIEHEGRVPDAPF